MATHAPVLLDTQGHTVRQVNKLTLILHMLYICRSRWGISEVLDLIRVLPYIFTHAISM